MLNLHRVRYKVSLDPVYHHWVDKLHHPADLDALYAAGFIDDGLAANACQETFWDIKCPTTPTQHLKQHDTSKKSCVLLSTGSFSPMHLGHIAMMEKTKTLLEQQGYTILGGYMSPSHDNYVSVKNQGSAAWDAEYRISLAQRMLEDHPWLRVCPWEARHATVSLNFSDVIARLKHYLQLHLQHDVHVVYVFGEDNAAFSAAFEHPEDYLCVPRQMERNPSISEEDWASSMIRQGFLQGIPKKYRDVYLNLTDKASKDPDTSPYANLDVQYYCVRNDLSQALSTFNVSVDHLEELKSKMDSIFHRYLSDHHVVWMEPLEPDALQSDYPILSLDTWVKGDAQLNMSRVFNLSDVQSKPLWISKRPGAASLHTQVEKMAYAYPRQTWTLVDDDSATGSTVQVAKGLIKDQYMNVANCIYLNDIALHKMGIPKHRVADVVDARDFILGAAHGGLVVALPNNGIGRAPYLFPYVNLSTRASIPIEKARAFTLDMLKLNIEWFHDAAKGMRLGDIDSASLSFWKIQYPTTTLMVDIAMQEHAKLCRND